MKDSISVEETIEYLNRRINNELEKPQDAQDTRLLGRCSELLGTLSSLVREDPESYRRLKARHMRKFKRIIRNRSFLRDLRSFMRVKGRVAAAFAAVIMVFGIGTMAYNGVTFDQLLDLAKDKFGDIKAGIGYNIGDTTITLLDQNITEYTSVKEAVEAEGLDIYYPAWLPDGVRIKSVTVSREEDMCCIYYVLHPNIDTMTVSLELNKTDRAYENYDSYEKIIIGDYEVYAAYFDEKYYAVFNIGENEYSITAEDKTSLKKIISGLTKG